MTSHHQNQHGPPIKVEGRTPHHQGRPSTNTISSHHTANNAQRSAFAQQRRARRAASQRLPVLDSGRSDPWWYPPPGERGYEDAANHLLDQGLLPAPNRQALEAMWRRGGRSQQAALFIARAWDLVA